MYRIFLGLAVVTASLAALPAVGKDIVDTAVEAGDFKTLVTAVKAAGLVDTLKGDGPFTVFAPSDAAFAKIPKETLAELLKPENKGQLQSILTYHVVPGKVKAKDLLKVAEAKTVQGMPAKFGLTVQGANIVATDIECSNGIIHVIDTVIMPPKKEKETANKAASNSAHREMIETAVAKGSHMYNSGHACQCADLYMQTMTKLSKVDSLPNQMQDKIHHTMEVARKASSSDKRAWVLRRGLDSLYEAM